MSEWWQMMRCPWQTKIGRVSKNVYNSCFGNSSCHLTQRVCPQKSVCHLAPSISLLCELPKKIFSNGWKDSFQ